MKRIQTLLSIFAVFAFFAISSSAFASEEVNWEVTPAAKALAAASSAVYDQDYLNGVASDAGADIIPSARSLAASLFYQYNEGQVAAGVADDSDGYFVSEHQSAEVKAIVNHASGDSLICQSC